MLIILWSLLIGLTFSIIMYGGNWIGRWLQLFYYYREHSNPLQLGRYHKRLQRLFADQAAFHIALQERKKLTQNQSEYIYGEIPFSTLVEVLNIVKPLPGEVFYDLGSGSGIAVLGAALLYDLRKCCGIESLRALQEYSLGKLAELSHWRYLPRHFSVAKIYMINGDYYLMDFSDADIVYINATGIFGEQWRVFQEKLCQLKPNSRIITTSRKIDSDEFLLLDSSWRAMSWGPNRVHIYQKMR